MINLGENIRMRVQVQEADRLALGDLAPSNRLNNSASNRMVTADGNGPCAGFVNFGVKPGDVFDAGLVIVGTREEILDLAVGSAWLLLLALRQLKVVISDLSVHGGAQVAIDATLVSTLTRRGTARARAH